MSADAPPCPGCGGVFAPSQGPVHRYMTSSPGCWAVFGEVLAREFGDPGYWSVHRLTVDAYAVQHPGSPSPQTIQSVAVHLISLHAALELGQPSAGAAGLLKRAADTRSFPWLEPPESRGRLTVGDVLPARSAAEHARRVTAWAESAWQAWAPYHAQVRNWTRELLDGTRS